MPGWGLLTLTSVWGSDQGQLILAGNGQDDTGESTGFLGWIGRDRTDRHIAKVPGYVLNVMTVGPRGMIWAVRSNREEPPGSNILLRFSPDGKLLTSTYLSVRRGGALRKDKPPLGGRDVAFNSRLRASLDRVAWLTTRNEYIEFDSTGSVTLQLNGPSTERYGWMHDTLAISAANTVLISTRHWRDNQAVQDFWSLDRLKQRWFHSEAAEATFPSNTQVYGFDGEDLMTSGHKPQLGQLLVRYRLSETK